MLMLAEGKEWAVKFMLLIYSNSTVWEELSEHDRQELAREHQSLIKELEASGEWIGGSPLADPSTTRTVRMRDAVGVSTDGPLAETKEHLAGYDIVDCESSDRAVEIAKQNPHARLAAIEVRALMHDSAIDI